MTHACLTAAIPFPDSRADEVEAALGRLGNPAAEELRGKMDGLGIVHFMSAVVVRDVDRGRAHLVLEISADGAPEDAARRIGDALEPELRSVLDAAGLPRDDQPLGDLLLRRNLRLGHGWSCTPGVVFVGAPAVSVRRVLAEKDLAAKIGGMRDVLESRDPPMRKLERVRERLWKDEGEDGKGWKWAFAAEPTPFFHKGEERTTLRVLIAGALSLAALLWPLLVVPVALAFLVGVWPALLTSALLLALAGGGAVAWLRWLEERDRPDDSQPEAPHMAAILEQENRGAQNLLVAVSRMKPGLFRLFALRFAFGMVAEGVARFARPGFLRTMGVIHFGRWALLPGTGRLLFFSNFSNSWDSYLEDFIVKAPSGVTSIWSNAQGFPRTRFLFEGGVADRAGFLRWARGQQVPVPFWYSAYPDLTMGRIRTNAAIRQGVASARTEADAADWLACFGGAPRPAFALDKPEIPTLAFGGLRKLRHAHCLVLALPPDPMRGRAWLGEVAPQVTFGENAGGSALVLGLSATGLRRLDVAGEDLATFPVAFQHGMAAPARRRLLNDTGPDDAAHWAWGGERSAADVFVAIYHERGEKLRDAVRCFRGRAEQLGLAVVHSQGLASLPAERRGPGAARGRPPRRFRPERRGAALARGRRPRPSPEQGPARGEINAREPFGFVDGLSQPILRDTPKARCAVAADHVVEAGEFILGYPDNSGRLPPMPSVAAGRDPKRTLPAVASEAAGVRPSFQGGGSEGRRELGRNGTFLVVRQLDQYPSKLHQYALEEAERLLKEEKSPWDLPSRDLAELLEAKMVGRWKDGRPLVRHPDPGCSGGGGDPGNDFRFTREDPQGFHCPFGAHIRRANPRDTLDGGPAGSVAASNRHRILRVGRPCEPKPGGNPGLMFMCLNADIERQFEFIQRNWVFGRNFQETTDEVDPLVGHALGDPPRPSVFTIPTPHGPIQLRGVPDFVRVRGGGYFFLPGRQALRYLAGGAWAPGPGRP